MNFAEIVRQMNSLMRDLLRRDMKPVHLFVDHHTYLAIKCWADACAYVVVMKDMTTTEYFYGLELHEVETMDRLIVVAP